ncbi:MAG: hypothetical protein ACFFAX_06945 [Promethearchaeota archaeon]
MPTLKAGMLKPMAVLVLILFMVPLFVPIVTPPSTLYSTETRTPLQESLLSSMPNETIPMRRATFVGRDSSSYFDEFAYMAGIPNSVFLSGGNQYVSPLIMASGSQSEEWFVSDWAEYIEPDGGASQIIGVGDLSNSLVDSIQDMTGVQVYPRITGLDSAEVAAQLAAMDWTTSNIAVFALAKDSFPAPSVTSGEASFTFQDAALSTYTSSESVNYGSIENITFTPPSSAVWMEGTFDWSGSDLHTHQLRDPSGAIVDYSVYSQVYFERNPSYVATLVPLKFWYPKTQDGTWTMAVERLSTGITDLSCEVKYHPGFTQTVPVPSDAQWLNATITWDNTATDLNLALVGPNGRLVQWAPAGSILAGLSSETVEIPYPTAGDWTIMISWIDATEEENNVDLSWVVSTLPSGLQAHLESAANGAVLASLMNAPLLYVTEDSVPEATLNAVQRLGVNVSFLVDPANIHTTALETELDAFSFLTSLESYSLMTQWIQMLSEESDIILTVPLGNGNEVFAPAAYSAAFHGAPILSLCGDDNYLTTRAEETWAPYLVGPDIDIYITTRWTTRNENGWYDERIPNTYSMRQSVNDFEDFLIDRGAYNATGPQSVVIVSSPELIKVSFDRSLQSHFQAGRIPTGDPALASVLINRAAHHRFLFLTSDSAEDAMLTFYAYTDGSPFVDNFLNGYEIWQIEDSTSALQNADFNVVTHVGANEVFATVDTQLALWSMSTHGTLSQGPRDPPARPSGPGLFSLRDQDANWGFEVSESTRESPSDVDHLVNPVAYEAEFGHHVMRTTDDLEAAIGNIGSPIVILTACLLGGTRLPIMLMEHGAVGVIASPRTVYFQPAGTLSIQITESLCSGNATGSALSDALVRVSHDYSDPLIGREPRDYGNQQVLFGDPEVHLYSPTSSPRISSVDPSSISLDGHQPGRGVPALAAFGTTDYLPQTLDDLSIDHDFYDDSNLTDSQWLLSLRFTVLVEPGSLPSLSTDLASMSQILERYVEEGGTLVIMGVSGDLSWLPWVLSTGTSSGSTIVIEDTTHPLMSMPNVLASAIDYQNHFTSFPENMTILATDGTNPVIIAGVVGSGKLAVTTTHPAGTARNQSVENAALWSSMPSLVLHDASLNQLIIWEGDRVIITLEITTRSGVGIGQVSLQSWLNSTEITVVASAESGLYTITLTEDWTRGRVGTYSLYLTGTKAGYDSLTVVLLSFMTIRPFPWEPLLLVGGVFAAIVGASIYTRRRRGDRVPKKTKRMSKEERQREKEDRRRQKAERERRKKEDAKVDPKEFFGV